MKTHNDYKTDSFLEKGLEYMCTGLVVGLCVIWGLVLLVIYLVVLIIANVIRLFHPEL